MNVGIFVIGAVVTAMVVGALVLLFYGAVLDGRDTGQDTGVPGRPEFASDNVTRLEPVAKPTSLRAA
jgi:hypothetical protein